MDNNKKIIRKESCWILSNILADTMNDINPVIDMEVLTKLINIISTDELEVINFKCLGIIHIKVKIEALHAIENFIAEATLDHVKMIISKGLLEVIVSNLDKDNSSKLLSITLVCISL